MPVAGPKLQRPVGFRRGPVHQIRVVLGLGFQINNSALGFAKDLILPRQELGLEVGQLPLVHKRLVVGRTVNHRLPLDHRR
ncbi:hypothetical protein D3C80_1543000 [compost metagenome]